MFEFNYKILTIATVFPIHYNVFVSTYIYFKIESDWYLLKSKPISRQDNEWLRCYQCYVEFRN